MWCPECKEKGILNELTRFEDNYICDECNGSFTFGMNQEKKKEKKKKMKIKNEKWIIEWDKNSVHFIYPKENEGKSRIPFKTKIEGLFADDKRRKKS